MPEVRLSVGRSLRFGNQTFIRDQWTPVDDETYEALVNNPRFSKKKDKSAKVEIGKARPDDVAELHGAIVDATDKLDKDDKYLWDHRGLPRRQALAELLGFDVKNAEIVAALKKPQADGADTDADDVDEDDVVDADKVKTPEKAKPAAKSAKAAKPAKTVADKPAAKKGGIVIKRKGEPQTAEGAGDPAKTGESGAEGAENTQQSGSKDDETGAVEV